MRFFATASALLAMATAAIAQTGDFNPVYTPKDSENVVAGSTFEITWAAPEKYADGTVSLHLIGGATQGTQVPLADIASGIPNSANKYSWAVDASLGDAAIYGLVIKLESDPSIFQYSNPFHIVKGEDNGEDGGEHSTETGGVVVTTKTGVKTVTLSSCPPTSSTEVPIVTTSSAIVNTTSSTPVWTTSTTQAANSTTSFVVPTHPPTTIIPPPVVPTTTPGVPTHVPTEVPVGSAGRLSSGAFAVIGGVVVALLL